MLSMGIKTFLKNIKDKRREKRTKDFLDSVLSDWSETRKLLGLQDTFLRAYLESMIKKS